MECVMLNAEWISCLGRGMRVGNARNVFFNTGGILALENIAPMCTQKVYFHYFVHYL